MGNEPAGFGRSRNDEVTKGERDRLGRSHRPLADSLGQARIKLDDPPTILGARRTSRLAPESHFRTRYRRLGYCLQAGSTNVPEVPVRVTEPITTQFDGLSEASMVILSPEFAVSFNANAPCSRTALSPRACVEAALTVTESPRAFSPELAFHVPWLAKRTA